MWPLGLLGFLRAIVLGGQQVETCLWVSWSLILVDGCRLRPSAMGRPLFWKELEGSSAWKGLRKSLPSKQILSPLPRSTPTNSHKRGA
jgi:hypothetical protein